MHRALVADLSPAHLRGRYRGAYSITWSLAVMCASNVSTRIILATSLRTFWSCCLGVGLLVALVHALGTSRLLPPKKIAPEA